MNYIIKSFPELLISLKQIYSFSPYFGKTKNFRQLLIPLINPPVGAAPSGCNPCLVLKTKDYYCR